MVPKEPKKGMRDIGDLKARLGLKKKKDEPAAPQQTPADTGASRPSPAGTAQPTFGQQDAGFSFAPPDRGVPQQQGGWPPPADPAQPYFGGTPQPPLGVYPPPSDAGFGQQPVGYPQDAYPPQAAHPDGYYPGHEEEYEYEEEEEYEEEYQPPPRPSFSPPTEIQEIDESELVQPKRSSRWLLYVIPAVVISVFASFIFYNVGSNQVKWQEYNDTTSVAKETLNLIEPAVKSFRDYIEVYKPFTNQSLDINKRYTAQGLEHIKKYREANFMLDTDNLPTGIIKLKGFDAWYVVQYVTDVQLLEVLIVTHIQETTTDMAEILELTEQSGEEDAATRHFALTFNETSYLGWVKDPLSYTPIAGHIVKVGEKIPREVKPEEDKDKDKKKDEEEEFVSPDKYKIYLRTGQEDERFASQIILIPRNEFLQATGANALVRYELRMTAIISKMRDIDNYTESMLTELKKVAGRDSQGI